MSFVTTWPEALMAAAGNLQGMAGLRYSPGSRANRPRPTRLPPAAAQRASSVALSSMAAILVTETTSSSRARPQAVFTGCAP